MAIRKTRRQVVMDAAAISAIYASGWGKAPVPVAAEPVAAPLSPAMAEIARLTGLVVAAEAEMTTALPNEQERLADLLDCAERQCRFMADCMDGTLGKRMLQA